MGERALVLKARYHPDDREVYTVAMERRSRALPWEICLPIPLGFRSTEMCSDEGAEVSRSHISSAMSEGGNTRIDLVHFVSLGEGDTASKVRALTQETT